MSSQEQTQSMTVPVNPEPSNQSDPAHVPSPMQQPVPPLNPEPWQTEEFKKKVVAAGFPGSPHTDEAFLSALYRFGSGSTQPAP